MQEIFFTPGPAQLYPTVSTHIQTALNEHIGSISHRSKRFMEIHQETIQHLQDLLGFGDEFYVFFHSSATEIWERLLQNCVEQCSFHYVNGAFSQRFRSFAQQLKIPNIYVEEVEWGNSFEYAPTVIPSGTEMINFTHNESSTGVMMPLEKAESIRKAFPKAILTLDTVSSIPYGQLDWKVWDAVYFSVQKGFGLPAGLGVLIVHQKCIEKSKELVAKGKVIGTYHSFPAQLEKFLKHQTVETPNVMGIYLLGKVAGEMKKEGVNNLTTRLDKRAEELYSFLEKHEVLSPFVQQRATRSATVITVSSGQHTKAIIEDLRSKGFHVGSGYGKLKQQQFRIANFPAIPDEVIHSLIRALEEQHLFQLHS